MTIVAKIGGGEIYIPFEFRSKGLIKKTHERHQDFKDLASIIDYCKRHNENYEGLVDDDDGGWYLVKTMNLYEALPNYQYAPVVSVDFILKSLSESN